MEGVLASYKHLGKTLVSSTWKLSAVSLKKRGGRKAQSYQLSQFENKWECTQDVIFFFFLFLSPIYLHPTSRESPSFLPLDFSSTPRRIASSETATRHLIVCLSESVSACVCERERKREREKERE